MYDDVHSFCVKSWEKLNCEIKIFDYNNDDVKFVKQDCFEHFKSKSIAIRTDAIRMYILSKYPYYLYLDWDVYVKDFFTLNKCFVRPYFWSIYNHNNLNFFNDVYSMYKNGIFKNTYDCDVSKKINIQCTESIPQLIHLYSTDRKYYLYSSNKDVAKKYAHSNVCVINEYCEKIHNCINCDGDKSLIDFLRNIKGRTRIYDG